MLIINLLQISSCFSQTIFSHRENIDVHLHTVLLFTEADSHWSGITEELEAAVMRNLRCVSKPPNATEALTKPCVSPAPHKLNPFSDAFSLPLHTSLTWSYFPLVILLLKSKR